MSIEKQSLGVKDMEWSQAFKQDVQPTLEEIEGFIHNELWQALNAFIHSTYGVEPMIEYSDCGMQRGWNVKYRKGGKSLCTLYPMSGYFIALVVVGKKEVPEAELLLPSFSEYTQALYHSTDFYIGGKWLMMYVTDYAILADAMRLMELRAKPREPKGVPG